MGVSPWCNVCTTLVPHTQPWGGQAHRLRKRTCLVCAKLPHKQIIRTLPYWHFLVHRSHHVIWHRPKNTWWSWQIEGRIQAAFRDQERFVAKQTPFIKFVSTLSHSLCSNRRREHHSGNNSAWWYCSPTCQKSTWYKFKNINPSRNSTDETNRKRCCRRVKWRAKGGRAGPLNWDR